MYACMHVSAHECGWLVGWCVCVLCVSVCVCVRLLVHPISNTEYM